MAENLYFCNVPGCKHAHDRIPSLPFSRRDKLLQHQRQVGHDDSVNSSQAIGSQSADTTTAAIGPSDGNMMQTETETQMQMQGAQHLPILVEVQADGEMGEVVLSPNVNLGEAGGNLVAKVKAMRERHAAEIKKLKEEQEMEMRILRDEVEKYEQEIVIAREFLGD